jgi:hypothetical protein
MRCIIKAERYAKKWARKRLYCIIVGSAVFKTESKQNNNDTDLKKVLKLFKYSYVLNNINLHSGTVF